MQRRFVDWWPKKSEEGKEIDSVRLRKRRDEQVTSNIIITTIL